MTGVAIAIAYWRRRSPGRNLGRPENGRPYEGWKMSKLQSSLRGDAPGFNRVAPNPTRFSQPFQRFLSRLPPLANGEKPLFLEQEYVAIPELASSECSLADRVGQACRPGEQAPTRRLLSQVDFPVQDPVNRDR